MVKEKNIKKKSKIGQSPIIFQKKNSKGQFYLIATIIIVGLVIGLAVTFNYSTKSNSHEAEEIAKELQIESENVMDYDTLNPGNAQFENFARDYSAYIGKDKDIYFIIVNGGYREAYKYTNGAKIDLSSSLNVNTEEKNIQFTLENEIYSFKLNEGKNFYFLVVQKTGGEKYVFSG